MQHARLYRHFKALEVALGERGYMERVELSGEPTKHTSGAFEVQVVGGSLLWSKTRGDGYVNSEAKYVQLFAGVDAALKAAGL